MPEAITAGAPDLQCIVDSIDQQYRTATTEQSLAPYYYTPTMLKERGFSPVDIRDFLRSPTIRSGSRPVELVVTFSAEEESEPKLISIAEAARAIQWPEEFMEGDSPDAAQARVACGIIRGMNRVLELEHQERAAGR